MMQIYVFSNFSLRGGFRGPEGGRRVLTPFWFCENELDSKLKLILSLIEVKIYLQKNEILIILLFINNIMHIIILTACLKTPYKLKI